MKVATIVANYSLKDSNWFHVDQRGKAKFDKLHSNHKETDGDEI